MLAQNFKTAADLHISEVEVKALVKVLGMLERREITNFSMRSFKHSCGSPACICGWAHAVSDGRAFPELAGKKITMRLNNRLPGQALRLFDIGVSQRGDATVEQAATALRSYLTTGDPRWNEAMAS